MNQWKQTLPLHITEFHITDDGAIVELVHLYKTHNVSDARLSVFKTRRNLEARI